MKAKCIIAVFCFFSAIASGQSETDLWTKYEKDLKASPQSSVTLFRIGEIYFQQGNFQAAAISFGDALKGDLQPKWIQVWSHIYLGKIFDMTGSQRDRALNEYTLAQRTNDDTRGALEEAGPDAGIG